VNTYDRQASNRSPWLSVGGGKRRVRVSPKRADRPEHPTPVQAVEWLHAKQAQILAARDDRFSRLLSRLLQAERRGQHVLSTSDLSEEDHAELDHWRRRHMPHWTSRCTRRSSP
jgi:hypothetical protein